ncbi:hypothetical protein HNV12_20795 [Methanococcoides sp. SA1]|nr:hypothetical protein [Methanococcoides sp. SA1]
MNNNDLLVKLQKQTKFNNLIQNGICSICGETNPHALDIYENHHISGGGFSDETRVLCLNCHATITQAQNGLPPKLRSRKLDNQYLIPYVFLSHSALRSRMAEIEVGLIDQFYGLARTWNT